LRLQTDESGARLRLSPCLPVDWPGYALNYRYRDTTYTNEVAQVGDAPAGLVEVRVDGTLQPDGSVPLRDDRVAHTVSVVVSAAAAGGAEPL
jgi:cellobiose phosphorylase